jgi:hypothetical protein
LSVVWVRKKLAGFIQPAPGFGGLQVKPAPEPATKGGPAAGGRKIRVLPEAGAVHFPIFGGLQIEPALCKNTHIQ